MIGTVDIKTRPLRLAHLVNPNKPAQIREAIRLSSTLWGGAYCPIIPLYKEMPPSWTEKPLKTPSAKEVILGYLEAFDPDILVQFSENVPGFITHTGLRVIKPMEVWGTLDEGRGLSPQFGIGIFELLNDVFNKHFKYIPKYPLRVVFPRMPDQLSLFWASWLGEIPPKIVHLLEKHYFQPLEIQATDFDEDKLLETVAPDVLFPTRIARYGLTQYSNSRFRGGACVYLLDASKTSDVIDFWNLRALGKAVLPIPIQLREHPKLKDAAVAFLKAYSTPQENAIGECASIVPARSRTVAELKEYVENLEIKQDNDDSGSISLSIAHGYPRVWNEWARNKSGETPSDFYGDNKVTIDVSDPQKIKIRALMPEFAHEHGYHGEPRCANEVSFLFYGTGEYIAEAFPKYSGKNYSRAISGILSFREWRVGRNGLVRLVAAGFSDTRTIPLAEEIFFPWLEDHGWKPQLSPPGLLAKEIYKRLQGIPVALKSEPLLDLLELMNGGKVRREISGLEVEQERERPVGEVRSRLEGSAEGGNPHDYLIKRGVFKLGSKVQCPNCLRNTWFSLESLGDILTCPKCLNSFPAIGHVAAPDWSYKTAGPFSVPRYAEGAYTVLLTLELLAGHKSPSMLTTPVPSFRAVTPDKKEIEVDLAMFWQESILGDRDDGVLFGECKEYGVFKGKDFDRMRYLAKCFPGAVLVFSTLRKELTAREITSIKRIAKAGRKYWKPERPINPVLILTGTELLGWSGPPHCWRVTVQAKFERVQGLMGLCDATQQIYLNLPSWHTEWRERWEKRLQGPQAKKMP